MNKIYENQGMSAFDAFVALEEIEDEEILTEAKSYDLRNNDEMKEADNFRDEDQKTENVTLEVIDPDADAIEHMKDAKEYVGQMILQCNACKATMFIDMDKLEQSESDENMYNLETECPHCHTTNTGYTIVGQVGKAEEPAKEESETDAEADNDQVDASEMTFDNDTEEDTEAKEEPEAESGKEDTAGEPEEEFAWDETEDEDDTADMEDKTGEEVDSDDVEEDDTEEKEDKKKKDESITEDGEDEVARKQELKNKLKKAMGISESLEEGCADDCDPTQVTDESCEQPVEEELDLNSWEGTVESFLTRFTLEDQRLAVNLYNTDESKLASFDTQDDVSFDYKVAEVVEFNTDDDYLSINVSEPTEDDADDVCSVATLFERFKDSETTTFMVTNLDTDEEVELDSVDELIDQFGAMNIEGPIEAQNINFYVVTDETPEVGEETVTERLINNIIRENKLRERKVSQINTVEYFISESIKRREDLNKVYEQFILPCDSPMLTHSFKEVTGYRDDVDVFLESKNITREQYDLLQEQNNKSKEEEVIQEVKNEVTESLFKSVKNRMELSEVLEVLQNEKISYQVKRSTNEEYRYDIFVTNQPTVLTEEVDTEITPTDVPQGTETEYDIPEDTEEVDMNPEDEFEFDETQFDNAVNDYFMESYDEPVIFRTLSGELNEDKSISIHGIAEGLDKSIRVNFTLTPKNINESNGSETGYTVSNDISEEVFDYNLK